MRPPASCQGGVVFVAAHNRMAESDRLSGVPWRLQTPPDHTFRDQGRLSTSSTMTEHQNRETDSHGRRSPLVFLQDASTAGILPRHNCSPKQTTRPKNARLRVCIFWTKDTPDAGFRDAAVSLPEDDQPQTGSRPQAGQGSRAARSD